MGTMLANGSFGRSLAVVGDWAAGHLLARMQYEPAIDFNQSCERSHLDQPDATTPTFESACRRVPCLALEHNS